MSVCERACKVTVHAAQEQPLDRDGDSERIEDGDSEVYFLPQRAAPVIFRARILRAYIMEEWMYLYVQKRYMYVCLYMCVMSTSIRMHHVELTGEKGAVADGRVEAEGRVAHE